jgi:transposase
MGKPLSIDLRSQLMAAVSGGMSHRSAAERFGVSAAGAVRWVQAVNTGDPIEAKPQGGDTRSPRIKAFSGVILTAVAMQKDISFVELAELLRTEHGASFGAGTVWRYLDRHGMTFKTYGPPRLQG